MSVFAIVSENRETSADHTLISEILYFSVYNKSIIYANDILGVKLKGYFPYIILLHE